MDDFIAFFVCLIMFLPCGLAMIYGSIDALVCRRQDLGLRLAVVCCCGPAGLLMAYGSVTYCYTYLFP